VLAGAGFGIAALRRQSRRPAGGETDIAMGFAGVAIRPEMLPAAAHEVPAEAWAVDDIWLSGQFAAAGLPIRLRPEARAACTPRALPGPELQRSRVDGMSRAEANAACAAALHSRFGIWPPR
jgi:hypothetical protein